MRDHYLEAVEELIECQKGKNPLNPSRREWAMRGEVQERERILKWALENDPNDASGWDMAMKALVRFLRDGEAVISGGS